MQERFLRSRTQKEQKNRELHPQMEIDLYAWICQQKDSGIFVNRPMIGREALRLLPNNCPFYASDGWLQSFLNKMRYFEK